MPEKERPRIALAYVGRCKLVGGKKGTEWALVEGRKLIQAKRLVFGMDAIKGAKLRSTIIGNIYTFETTGDPEKVAIFPASRRWTGQPIDDRKAIIEWEAAADEDEQIAKAAKVTEQHAAMLAPFREEYRKRIGRTARALYLARIINYVTG